MDLFPILVFILVVPKGAFNATKLNLIFAATLVLANYCILYLLVLFSYISFYLRVTAGMLSGCRQY